MYKIESFEEYCLENTKPEYLFLSVVTEGVGADAWAKVKAMVKKFIDWVAATCKKIKEFIKSKVDKILKKDAKGGVSAEEVQVPTRITVEIREALKAKVLEVNTDKVDELFAKANAGEISFEDAAEALDEMFEPLEEFSEEVNGLQEQQVTFKKNDKEKATELRDIIAEEDKAIEAFSKGIKQLNVLIKADEKSSKSKEAADFARYKVSKYIAVYKTSMALSKMVVEDFGKIIIAIMGE